MKEDLNINEKEGRMKTTIKIAMIMFVVSCLSVPVFAGDIKVGIGAGATESGSTVYIPIKVPMAGNFLLVEPALSLSKITEDEAGVEVRDASETELGVGLFFGRPVTENIDILIGGRVSYVDQKETLNTGSTTENELDGFAIAPTLGIEYNVNPHIAIGGFVDYTYTNVDGTETSSAAPGVETKTETESFKPNTNLFVKFYF